MLQQQAEPETMNAADEISSAVLRAMLYFNIFNHPLHEGEIVENIALKGVAQDEVSRSLERMVKAGWMFRHGNYYSFSGDDASVKRRMTGNKLAAVYMKRAEKVSRFISWFPFVRSVMISGSLSKGYMDKGSDIDFFIITEKGRLWFCRSLLALQRKLMIGPMRKYFCINYFISTGELRIPDENIFTATEIAFVRPTYNLDVYHDFMELNAWKNMYYPNKPHFNGKINSKTYPFSLKRLVEVIFSGSLGERIDAAIFGFMLKRWKKRYAGFDETQFDLNIRTKKNVSKQHEKGYQTVVLKKYEQQINDFMNLHHVNIKHG